MVIFTVEKFYLNIDNIIEMCSFHSMFLMLLSAFIIYINFR